MTRTEQDFLFRIEAPWIYLGLGEVERTRWIPSHFYSRDGMTVCVRQLRGRKMRTTKALMDEFGAALQFFDGFGENWNALEECLMYMDEWLPANSYVLVIEHAEQLLQDADGKETETLLKVLHSVGEFLARPISDGDRFDRPSIPFHVLLHPTSMIEHADLRLEHAARNADVPIRQ